MQNSENKLTDCACFNQRSAKLPWLREIHVCSNEGAIIRVDNNDEIVTKYSIQLKIFSLLTKLHTQHPKVKWVLCWNEGHSLCQKVQNYSTG